MKTTILEVHGNVQGVGFRQNVKAAADVRNVLGYASNQPKGTVEIALQGGEKQIYEIISILKTSPAYSDVEKVVEKKTDHPMYPDFSIRTDHSHTQTSRYDARSDHAA